MNRRVSLLFALGRDSGCVLLPVMWLMAGLSLVLMCRSALLLDTLRLLQDRQQLTQIHVHLENVWQCQWWHWQQYPHTFPDAFSNCGIARMQIQWQVQDVPCPSGDGAMCKGAWVVLGHAYRGQCQQMRQYVLQRSGLSDDQRPRVWLWRGTRFWQSCAEASS